MKSFFVISLIVLIAAMVSAEESLSSLYSRRAQGMPTQAEYVTRNLHAQIAPNQEYGQSQQARAVAAQAAQAAQATRAAQAGQMSPSAVMSARQVDMMRQAADKAAIMVTRWAKALRETMIENAGREASAEGQAL